MKKKILPFNNIVSLFISTLLLILLLSIPMVTSAAESILSTENLEGTRKEGDYIYDGWGQKLQYEQKFTIVQTARSKGGLTFEPYGGADNLLYSHDVYDKGTQMIIHGEGKKAGDYVRSLDEVTIESTDCNWANRNFWRSEYNITTGIHSAILLGKKPQKFTIFTNTVYSPIGEICEVGLMQLGGSDFPQIGFQHHTIEVYDRPGAKNKVWLAGVTSQILGRNKPTWSQWVEASENANTPFRVYIRWPYN